VPILDIFFIEKSLSELGFEDLSESEQTLKNVSLNFACKLISYRLNQISLLSIFKYVLKKVLPKKL